MFNRGHFVREDLELVIFSFRRCVINNKANETESIKLNLEKLKILYIIHLVKNIELK